MKFSQFWSRTQSRYQRGITKLLYRRPIEMHNRVPYISFTFDDFPRTAFNVGGAILMRFGLRATYYASFGLVGTDTPTGTIFMPEDIKELFAQGHELGCHTFSHCDTWETSPIVFEREILKNKHALDNLFPGAIFRSLAYPISGPRYDTKRKVGRYFCCCRGGGQTFNAGTADLNLLKAYFLEKSRDHPASVKEVIDQNCQALGWLIFGTHDISDTPTPYGCRPSFFEDIVKYSLDSGARILPVAKALDEILDGDKSPLW